MAIDGFMRSERDCIICKENIKLTDVGGHYSPLHFATGICKKCNKTADEIDEHIRMEEEEWKERKFHPPFNLNYKTGKYDDPKDLV